MNDQASLHPYPSTAARNDGNGHGNGRRLAYVSGAVRVSTRSDAETGGPRAHILGVTSAFQTLGWELNSYIMGDRVPGAITHKSEHLMRGKVGALAADLARIALRYSNQRRVFRELGQVDWVYERFASFQALGKIFQRHGSVWILETNGLFYREAKTDRESMLLTDVARRFEVGAYRDCDVLICVSRTLRDIICAETGVDPNKILVVPNGVDTEFFHPDHHIPERHSDAFTVGFVGRLIAWQGIDVLLEALSEVRREHNFDIKLTLAGDGSMSETWRRMASELGLSEHVTFLGQVPLTRVPAIIGGFDIGFSGQVELKTGGMYHSPLKIYEYMAMAKPVLASAYDDSESVVRPGATGYLFRSGDRETLKSALIRAYQMRDSLPLMGATAREQIIANHSWCTRVQQMVNGITSIVENRTCGPSLAIAC